MIKVFFDACVEMALVSSSLLLGGIVLGSGFLTARQVFSRRRKEGGAMDKSKKGGNA